MIHSARVRGLTREVAVLGQLFGEVVARGELLAVLQTGASLAVPVESLAFVRQHC
jgi:hypothetical protein